MAGLEGDKKYLVYDNRQAWQGKERRMSSAMVCVILEAKR